MDPGKTPPSDVGDVRVVRQELPGCSIRRICAVLHLGRSSLKDWAARHGKRYCARPELEAKVQLLIQEHPGHGYRRLWALLKCRLGLDMNRKRICQLLKRKHWLVHQRIDGWAHLVAVIDCCDRELVGWEFAIRGRAKEAEGAIEEACIKRSGTLRPPGDAPLLRSDNGLIFPSRRFRSACRDSRLRQEFITPCTPEQNGIIERFSCSLKEECAWQKQFKSFAEAKREISQWIEWYNAGRPHQSLGYKSPREYRVHLSESVA
jgi:putative transposase